jgi:transcriptional regulator with XRE-family HTH domain
VFVAAARTRQALTQEQLASISGIDRTRISRIERGEYLPTLTQLLDLARSLGVSLQWFFTGFNAPDIQLAGLAIELRSLGLADLFVAEARVPGAFRPPEQVVALALRGHQPEPRIVEAIPAILAWNSFFAPLLLAYSERHDPRVTRRVGWLADVTLTIHRTQGFPGGCRDQILLEQLVVACSRDVPTTSDDLGRVALEPIQHPAWKRWRITYAGSLSAFVERAEHLHKLRGEHRGHGIEERQA